MYFFYYRYFNKLRSLRFSPANYIRDEGQYEPEEIMDMLNRLGNLIQIERKMEKWDT